MSLTKVKTVWCCIECGAFHPKWLGQCPQCRKWNTLAEEMDPTRSGKRYSYDLEKTSRSVRVNEVETTTIPRTQTGLKEFDRLLGGGLVRGSFCLVGGDPGIGKSTLLLQVAQALAIQGIKVLYVSGEESIGQTSLRAQRVGVDSENLFLFAETHYTAIREEIERLSPEVVIVDSIQIVYKAEIPSPPGSVSQVRETAAEFMHLAKGKNISILLIGHVTKSGEIAGPRLLEHLVDTVLYFEGDRQHHFRMMRVVKNRFGATDEVAVFQMGQKGLTEVENPSQIFLEERMRDSSGSVVIPTLEGSRAILIEVQALVTHTAYPTPSRRFAGLDHNRLGLLLAVLERRVGLQLHNRDVFASVAGGMRIDEPAVDLGVMLACASSLSNRVVDPDTVVMGEVGLSGEVRSVARTESRLKEALHMGFKKAIVPKRNLKGLPEELLAKIKVHGIDYVEEAIESVLH